MTSWRCSSGSQGRNVVSRKRRLLMSIGALVIITSSHAVTSGREAVSPESAATAWMGPTPTTAGVAAQAAGRGYDTVPVSLPRGDAEAGRQAFIDLRCTACHRVSNAPDLPDVVSTTPGPELGPELAPQPLGNLATSIVSPSHAMSIRTSPETREQVDGVLSPMADYTQVMTIRQLVDLVAYLDVVRRGE